MRTFLRTYKIEVILFFLCLILYGNTLTNGYVLDDFSVVKENTIVQKGLGGIGEIFKTHYREGYGYVQGNLYRPLALSLFALQWEIAPDNPNFAHLFNILFYGLLLLILYKVLFQIIPEQKLVLIACLLFAAHPIHTEVVANIKSADEIMAFGFFLTALYLQLKPKVKYRFLWISLLAFLAILSKESALVLFACVPLIFWLFKEFSIGKAIVQAKAYLIPTVLYFMLRVNALGSIQGDKTIATIDNLLKAAPNEAIRLATAIKIMGLYLWKLVFPHPLMNDYSIPLIPLSSFSDPKVLISLLIYLSLFIGLYYAWKQKNKVLSFAILFYLINMALYSNIFVMIGTSFGERLLFIPSLGFCLAIAYLLIKLFPKEQEIKLNSPSLLIALGIVALYGFKTIDRNKAWKDNFTLYSTDIENCDRSARCQYYYGLGLMKEKAITLPEGDERNRLLQESVQAFTASLNLLPTYSDAWGQRGLAFYRLKQYEQAVQDYQQSVKYNPNNAVTWSNLGSLYFETQQFQQAKTAYESALRANPNYVDALANYASTLGVLGDYNKAILFFKKAVAIKPSASYYQLIGVTYQNLGNEQEAQRYLQLARQAQ